MTTRYTISSSNSHSIGNLWTCLESIIAPKMPSLLWRMGWAKSEEAYQALGTSASLAQNAGRFFHDRNGSRSGLNISAVTRPRPRFAVTIMGMSSQDTTTRHTTSAFRQRYNLPNPAPSESAGDQTQFSDLTDDMKFEAER